LGSTAPEHELLSVPAALVEVAVVEHVGGVVSEAAVSPFTNPEYEGVIVGGVPPYVMVPDEAIIANVADPTTTAPFT